MATIMATNDRLRLKLKALLARGNSELTPEQFAERTTRLREPGETEMQHILRCRRLFTEMALSSGCGAIKRNERGDRRRGGPELAGEQIGAGRTAPGAPMSENERQEARRLEAVAFSLGERQQTASDLAREVLDAARGIGPERTVTVANEQWGNSRLGGSQPSESACSAAAAEQMANSPSVQLSQGGAMLAPFRGPWRPPGNPQLHDVPPQPGPVELTGPDWMQAVPHDPDEPVEMPELVLANRADELKQWLYLLSIDIRKATGAERMRLMQLQRDAMSDGPAREKALETLRAMYAEGGGRLLGEPASMQGRSDAEAVRQAG
jgi:hypothetical protein